MAAAMLAEKKDSQSIPSIKEALERAESVLERFNLAQALLQLGEAQGAAALKSICEDDQARAELRLEAANRLAESGSSACAGSIVTVLASSSDHSIRAFAMDLLKRENKSFSPSLTKQLQTVLEDVLLDEIPSNRQHAAECLVHFKLSGAANSLRSAVLRERDPEIRDRLQQSLSRLEGPAP